jgi:hypothetical protein
MTDFPDQRDRATKERSIPGPRGGSTVALRLVVVWAVAATILAGIFAVGGIEPGFGVRERIVPSATWGWAGIESLPQPLSRTAYLGHLAEAAEEWYRVAPDDPLSLARRVNELRQGFSILLMSDHRPLTPEDRAWLVDSCRTWAARCNGYLIALEAGSSPRIVRGQVDRLIEEVAASIRRQIKSRTSRGNPSDRPPAP